MSHNIINASPALTHLSGDVLLASSVDDVEKLKAIQDGFIHYQLLRFCQTTRLQYINSHFLLGNRCILQQHVDCKIADALLKKGT